MLSFIIPEYDNESDFLVNLKVIISNFVNIISFFKLNNNSIYISKLGKIIQDDIGTPCGIIPFDIADKSTWELKYGGDFDYYNNLQKHSIRVEFLDLIIYIV